MERGSEWRCAKNLYCTKEHNFLFFYHSFSSSSIFSLQSSAFIHSSASHLSLPRRSPPLIMHITFALLASLAMTIASPVPQAGEPKCSVGTPVCCNGATTPLNLVSDSCIRCTSWEIVPPSFFAPSEQNWSCLRFQNLSMYTHTYCLFELFRLIFQPCKPTDQSGQPICQNPAQVYCCHAYAVSSGRIHLHIWCTSS